MASPARKGSGPARPTVADCEGCLAVWKQNYKWCVCFAPFQVADCEDCLAVWKQEQLTNGSNCQHKKVADCEDCLAVWKHMSQCFRLILL